MFQHTPLHVHMEASATYAGGHWFPGGREVRVKKGGKRWDGEGRKRKEKTLPHFLTSTLGPLSPFSLERHQTPRYFAANKQTRAFPSQTPNLGILLKQYHRKKKRNGCV